MCAEKGICVNGVRDNEARYVSPVNKLPQTKTRTKELRKRESSVTMFTVSQMIWFERRERKKAPDSNRFADKVG